MMTASARLPFGPVEELVRRSWRPLNPPFDQPFGTAALADRLDVSRHTVIRWRRDGLTEQRADEAAIRLGSHPAILWPAWYEAVVA